jgi:hypothetical protein
MRRSLLALPLAAVALLAGTADAAPKPKPVTKSYDVVLPVPFPASETAPPLYGCIDGAESVSKNTTRVTLPYAGSLAAQVTFTGDWDLYVFDTKGKMIGAAENDTSGSTGAGKEKLVVKKAKKGPVDIVTCNWAGTPQATVTWTLTPAK